jgi:hypothetical protein
MRQVLLVGTAAALLSTGATMQAQTTASCTFRYFTPPAPYNVAFAATGINHAGTMVGQTSSSSVAKGWLRYANGAQTLYSFPGSGYTSLSKRNAAGTSVGFYLPSGQSQPVGMVLTSSLKPGTLKYPGSFRTILNGINKANVIVGTYSRSYGDTAHGFKYQNGKFIKVQFPGAIQTVPEAINDNGVIVGEYVIGSLENAPHAFLLKNGSYHTLNLTRDPNGTQRVTDINNAGTIIGAVNVIYRNGVAKRVTVPASYETFVYGINDVGTITGVANFNLGNEHYVWIAFTATCQ